VGSENQVFRDNQDPEPPKYGLTEQIQYYLSGAQLFGIGFRFIWLYSRLKLIISIHFQLAESMERNLERIWYAILTKFEIQVRNWNEI
jgi:hypothetical protein